MSSYLAVNLRNMRERLVPARLQFASDQPIGRIGGVVLPEGAVGSIARRFEIAMKGLAHLIAALARLLLRGAAAAMAPSPTTVSSASSMASSTRKPPKAMQAAARHCPSSPDCSCSVESGA